MYQNNAQAQINAEQDRWDWTRDQPLNRLQDYSGLVNQAGGTGLSGQISPPNLQSPLQSGLMGAGAGLNAAGFYNQNFGGGDLVTPNLYGNTGG